MTLTAALILLAAAGTHAGWNFLNKRNHTSAAFLLVANLFGCVYMAVPLIFVWRGLAAFTPAVYAWLALTGVFQAIYYRGLAGAYRNGDMSVSYPLARSLPVILVTLVNFALGRSDQISLQALGGMLLIAAGGVLLPMRHFSEWRLRNYFNLASLWALIAAFGTTGYSIIDDHALRILRTSPELSVSITAVTLCFVFFESVTSTFWTGVIVFSDRRGRVELNEVLHKHLGATALTGLGIHLAYTLVLISMAFVRNVSYVVAFRQTSILLGTLLGIQVLKEPKHVPKLVGLAVLFTGLVLVATG